MNASVSDCRLRHCFPVGVFGRLTSRPAPLPFACVVSLECQQRQPVLSFTRGYSRTHHPTQPRPTDEGLYNDPKGERPWLSRNVSSAAVAAERAAHLRVLPLW